MNGGDLPVISETNCKPGFGSDTKYNDFFFFSGANFLDKKHEMGRARAQEVRRRAEVHLFRN